MMQTTRLFTFDLREHEGTVRVSLATSNHPEPHSKNLNDLLQEPLKNIIFEHSCDGQMKLVKLDASRPMSEGGLMALFCGKCGSRETISSSETFGDFLLAIRRHVYNIRILPGVTPATAPELYAQFPG